MSTPCSSHSICLLVANYNGFVNYVADYVKRQVNVVNLNYVGPRPWDFYIRRYRRSSLYVFGEREDPKLKILKLEKKKMKVLIFIFSLHVHGQTLEKEATLEGTVKLLDKRFIRNSYFKTVIKTENFHKWSLKIFINANGRKTEISTEKRVSREWIFLWNSIKNGLSCL